MRIIGGTARSRLIEAPKGMDTRPTQDKVRESLFNILQWEIQGATVLDLFAGSGALGLEALSRGAHKAVFVDHARQAEAVIRQNITALGFADQARMVRADWESFLSMGEFCNKNAFDLVFLDPPYEMTHTGRMCQRMLESGLLAKGALLVIEHALHTPPRPETGFDITDARRYGDTGITFLRLAGKEGG